MYGNPWSEGEREVHGWSLLAFENDVNGNDIGNQRLQQAARRYS
jgi:hypothetical protein